MTRTAVGYDWGERSPRWAGIRSSVVDLSGLRAHVLRADPDPAAPADAATHLLIHPTGTGAWSWLDVMRPLSAHGPIVAPDLPGSGRTRPRRRGDARARESARFLCDLTDSMRPGRLVVHGHSMGGLVAVLFADLAPERVARLVLVDPAVLGDPDDAYKSPVFRTVERIVLAAVQSFATVVVPLSLRYKAATTERLAQSLVRVGTDASRISPDLLSLATDEIAQLRITWRSDAAVTALASTVAAMTVEQQAVSRAVDRIAAPTLLLWGADDRVITRVLIDQIISRRPDWVLRAFASVGHMPPWEAPERYAEAVGQWLEGGGAEVVRAGSPLVDSSKDST